MRIRTVRLLCGAQFCDGGQWAPAHIGVQRAWGLDAPVHAVREEPALAVGRTTHKDVKHLQPSHGVGSLVFLCKVLYPQGQEQPTQQPVYSKPRQGDDGCKMGVVGTNPRTCCGVRASVTPLPSVGTILMPSIMIKGWSMCTLPVYSCQGDRGSATHGQAVECWMRVQRVSIHAASRNRVLSHPKTGCCLQACGGRSPCRPVAKAVVGCSAR